MYLPPKIDSVASNGFGGQIDASNNFGNDNNSYGEVENVQDTFTTDNYDLSPTITEDYSDSTLGLFDTIARMSSGPVGSSLDQSNGYNTLSPEGNNFAQPPNKNNDYTSGVNLPGTNNNYVTLLGTTSIPTNKGVTAQTGTADGYGQNELLKTAQNQRPSKYNYNEATTASQFGQNLSTAGGKYSQKSTAENTAGGYGNTDFSTSKALLHGNNRIDGQNIYGQGGSGNIDPNRGRSFSVDNNGYGNTVPNSFGQKYTNNDYSQNRNGNIANTQFSIEKSIDISNNPSSINSIPNINAQDNPISKSTPQFSNEIINRNYGQNEFPNNLGFQAGGYNPEVSSSGYRQYPSGLNQGIPVTSQTYGHNDFEKPNSNYYSANSKNLPYSGEPFNQLLPINNGFELSSIDPYIQKPTGINKNQIADTSNIGSQSLNSVRINNGTQSSETSYQNSFGQSSPEVQSFNREQGLSNYENGFNLNLPNQLQGSNNLGQSGSYPIGNGENYGQTSPTYNTDRFNQDQQNQQLSNSYGPPAAPQSSINGRNPIQSPSNGPTNSGYNNQDRPSTGPNIFDQSRRSTSGVSNNYSQTKFQPSPSGNSYSQNGSNPLSSRGYYQGSPSNVLIGFEQNSQNIPGGRPNNYGPAGSQTLSTIKKSFNQNSPTNGAYPQGTSQGSKSYEENIVKPNIATTQLGGYNQNGLTTQSSGQESSSSYPGNGQGIGPGASKNGGDVGNDKTSTGSSADPGYGIRNQKKHSTLVPKGQFQNSNSPGSGNGVQVSSNANNNGNNVDEPGFNSFSNFAPGNQPNQPINPGTNNCDKNKHGVSINEAVFSPSNIGY
uniref:Uncharacterized protein n=1 Tax=Schizaphis graminum TaxID=13262 RepID=A0A2S2NY77_SCHGA